MPHPRAFVAMAHIIAVATLFAGGLPAVSPDPHGAAEVEPRSSGVVQAAIHSVNYPMAPKVPSVAANRDTLALPLCPTCQGCQKWPSGCRNADKSDVSIRFLLLADWGGTGGAPFCTPTETDTAAAMAIVSATVGAQFTLALGDNFYDEGIPTNASDPRFAATFEQVFTHQQLALPWYVIGGNHDHYGNITAQLAYTHVTDVVGRQQCTDIYSTDDCTGQALAENCVALPAGVSCLPTDCDRADSLAGGVRIGRGVVDARSTRTTCSGHRWQYPQLYYDFQQEIPGLSTSVHFIMIDTVVLVGNVLHYVASDQPVTPWTPAGIAASDRHWAWLEETLRKAASTADYIIVAGHYPVWSVGGHGPIDALVVRLRPLLEQYNVTAYISGHDHVNQFLDTGTGVQYHVVGAANGLENRSMDTHRGVVPNGSLKYFYGDNGGAHRGGFASATIDKSGFYVTYYDDHATPLYTSKPVPGRKKPASCFETDWRCLVSVVAGVPALVAMVAAIAMHAHRRKRDRRCHHGRDACVRCRLEEQSATAQREPTNTSINGSWPVDGGPEDELQPLLAGEATGSGLLVPPEATPPLPPPARAELPLANTVNTEGWPVSSANEGAWHRHDDQGPRSFPGWGVEGAVTGGEQVVHFEEQHGNMTPPLLPGAVTRTQCAWGPTEVFFDASIPVSTHPPMYMPLEAEMNGGDAVNNIVPIPAAPQSSRDDVVSVQPTSGQPTAVKPGTGGYFWPAAQDGMPAAIEAEKIGDGPSSWQVKAPGLVEAGAIADGPSSWQVEAPGLAEAGAIADGSSSAQVEAPGLAEAGATADGPSSWQVEAPGAAEADAIVDGSSSAQDEAPAAGNAEQIGDYTLSSLNGAATRMDGDDAVFGEAYAAEVAAVPPAGAEVGVG